MTRTIQGRAIATLLILSCILVSVPAIGQSGTKPPNGSVTTPVQVVNTPNVNVVNTPTVSLAGGASVGVTNTLNNQNNPAPLAVLEAIQPYEDSCSITLEQSTSGSCNLKAVPAGKRLVIEEVDLWGKLLPGDRPTGAFLTNPSTVINHAFVATVTASSNSFDFLAAHQPTRLYAASGVAMLCEVILVSPSNGGFWSCTISGFLVDVP